MHAQRGQVPTYRKRMYVSSCPSDQSTSWEPNFRSYWASRLPYNKVHGIPSHLTNLFVDLLDDASGGREGEHSAADLSRLQEVVRYGREPPFSSTHPWIVLVLGAVVGATAASAFWYQRARAR